MTRDIMRFKVPSRCIHRHENGPLLHSTVASLAAAATPEKNLSQNVLLLHVPCRIPLPLVHVAVQFIVGPDQGLAP